LASTVQTEDGRVYRCATRRLLKTLRTDQRHVVAAGDRVLFRPVEQTDVDEGIIERVEPRSGSLCRTSRGRQHIIVTNVDQVLIIASAAQPRLKPNFIDRMLVTAEKGRIRPIVCINKIDLVDPASLEPLVGVYSQMGYKVLLLSAKTGFGTDRFARVLTDRESVVAGQSGVGKSSLLNAVDENLDLPVAAVSADTQKGRHRTSTARLLPLSFGGYVVDTPGIRQFQLWDVIPQEVAGLYRDLRPYVSHCRFPNCTHTHEADCAVKNAVADSRLDERRYESYCHLFGGESD
jgi:ribosome biogenesis GTPase